LTRRTRWLAKSTRRRWEFLVQPRLVGLFLVFLAAAPALPLPFPGSNLIFLIPLFIYSVGILERDGVWIAIGHGWTLVDGALLFVFGGAVLEVLDRMWSWLW